MNQTGVDIMDIKKLLGFDAGTKSVTAKVGGKGGPIIIIPPDDGGNDAGGN